MTLWRVSGAGLTTVEAERLAKSLIVTLAQPPAQSLFMMCPGRKGSVFHGRGKKPPGHCHTYTTRVIVLTPAKDPCGVVNAGADVLKMPSAGDPCN